MTIFVSKMVIFCFKSEHFGSNRGPMMNFEEKETTFLVTPLHSIHSCIITLLVNNV